MDLKTLFHNPEELTDKELKVLRDKLRFSHTMPMLSAAISGFSMYLLDQHVWRKGHSWFRIGSLAAVGYMVGVYGTHNVRNSMARDFDPEIVEAFDKRYLNTVLNSTGFGNNYVSIMDSSEEMILKKPY